MAIEEKLNASAQELEKEIKVALLNKDMTQTELADLIGENRQQVNRAIKGEIGKKPTAIRNKIYKVLDIK